MYSMSDQPASPRPIPERALIPERAHRPDVADDAVEDAVAHFDAAAARAAAACPSSPPGPSTVAFSEVASTERTPHGSTPTRLLEEAVLARLDAGGEVRRAEMGRRAVEHDVDVGVDQLLEGIKARVAAVRRRSSMPLSFFSCSRAAAMRSGNTSASAASCRLGPASRKLIIAPRPRPPQPMRPALSTLAVGRLRRAEHVARDLGVGAGSQCQRRPCRSNLAEKTTAVD